MGATVRRLCVMVDIEGYSQHPAVEQIDAQYRLRQVTEYACARAGVRTTPEDRQDQGDGQLLLLRAGVDEPRTVATLFDGLRDALCTVNESLSWGRMRLRAAISQGAIQTAAAGYVGPAVVLAARLLDSAPLRAALRNGRDSDLAVMLADDLYQDLVAQGYPGLPASAFRRVDVSIPKKAFRARGWLRPMGRPADDPAVPLPPIDRGIGGIGGAAVLSAVAGAAGGLAAASAWDFLDDALHEPTAAGQHLHDEHGDAADGWSHFDGPDHHH